MVSWMMNSRPPKGFHYVPTSAEHIASILTHAIMIPISAVASIVLILKSRNIGTFLISLVFGVCLVVLFIVSSAFHISFYLNTNIQQTETLRKSDRAFIYLFIAACYSPWLFLVYIPDDRFFVHLKWLMWMLAFCGVAFEFAYSRKYPVMGIVFYIVYGVVPGLLLDSQMSFPGTSELKFSGALFLIGVMFFKSEGLVPFAHAIWHILVILGVSTHYLTVYECFYSVPSNGENFARIN